MTRPVYATAADLANYPGGTNVPPESVDTALRLASRIVDRLLRGRVYDTDRATGLPVDTDQRQALTDATCAIALEAHTTGATTAGSTQEWTQVGIGNVSLSGRTQSAGSLTVFGVPVPPVAIVALSDVGRLEVWAL